jgi:hypothetical protein
MGHCLRRGADDDGLADGSLQFFSLRDAGNRPHATLEVDAAAPALLQCRGKENKPPVARYLPSVQAWIRRERYHLVEEPKHTGLIEHDSAYHDISALPRGLHWPCDLDLSGTGVAALPPGLKVRGSLDLSGTRIAALSAWLRVGGHLGLQGTAVTALPPGLVVGGNLYLRGTVVTALPKRLKVGGHLDLAGSAIAALPERLKVGGNLDLRGSGITELPGGLKVGGDLYLPSIGVWRIPEDAVIRGGVIGLSPAPPVADPVSGREADRRWR